jgi:hypothetical protein
MRFLQQMDRTGAPLGEPRQGLNRMDLRGDDGDLLVANMPKSDPRLLHSNPPPLMRSAYDSMPAGYGTLDRLMPPAYSGMPAMYRARPGLLPPAYNARSLRQALGNGGSTVT